MCTGVDFYNMRIGVAVSPPVVSRKPKPDFSFLFDKTNAVFPSDLVSALYFISLYSVQSLAKNYEGNLTLYLMTSLC